MKKKIAALLTFVSLSVSLMLLSTTPAQSCGSGSSACVEDTLFLCRNCIAIDCAYSGYREAGNFGLCN